MRSTTLRRLGLFPAFFCLVAMLLAACGPASNGAKSTKAPVSQQIYRYGDVTGGPDISTFDPAQATDQPSLEAIQMVFTGLVQLDDHLQVQTQMAERYEISSDGLTYTFHLRPNLQFSDGQPLSATDVAYSLDRALSPEVANLNGVTLTYLGQIKGAAERVANKIPTIIGNGVKVLDPSTVQITIIAKTAYFLQSLTYPTAFVVERSVIDRWGLNKWTDHLSDNLGQGGDGPFVVQNYDHNTGITFVPNPKYYNAQPQLQKVYFTFYKTAETAFQAYQTGQVDLVKNPPPLQTGVVKALPNGQYGQSNQLTIDYIAMNYLYEPFNNVHIRQAFELAINKNVITAAIYKGTRTPTCHIVPDGMPGYDPDLQCPDNTTTTGDVNKAQALFRQGLQEENWTLATMPPIKITYRTNNISVDNAITTMRQEWKTVLNVDVGTQLEDFPKLVADAAQTACQTPDKPIKCKNKGLQMWALGWVADYPDPQDWLTLQFDKGAPNNQWNYGQNLGSAAPAQQRIQALMEKADTTEDQTSRLTMYNQAEQALVNDVAWMPLDQRTGTHVLKSYVVGEVFNAEDQIPPDEWANIYIAVH